MYSELQGAYGRDAFYRPKRYRPRELLSPLAAPHLKVEGREYPVLDLSSNGAALLVPLDESWPLEAAVEGLLMLHGREAQRVHARVVRAEQGPRGVRIGLGLTDGFLDLDAARRLDSHAHLELALTVGPLSRHATVPVALREAIAEAVHVVQYYKRSLEPHEADARARGEQAVCGLAARAYEGLSAHYTELRERASAAAEPIVGDARIMHAAKAYTETVLTPLLLGSPMIARAYQKPLGYPGDYRVMLYYYANAYEGDTAFAKLFHKLFINHPLSAGVCTRKDYVVGSPRGGRWLLHVCRH
jgi:extracellular factor (EF) 3-hydroxypalmitic acid methyl ester biosynthesis protein